MPDFIERHAVQIDHDGFLGAVDVLEGLVEAGASENELQKHLEIHPYILSQQFAHCHHVIPKVALGVQYETDFMCLDIPSSGREWRAVELESPLKNVITRQGRKTADLEHAIQQIRDWRAWVTENLSYARQSRESNGLGLTEITPRFYGHVIIGRRKNFNNKFNELRRQLVRDELIEVHSWDGVVEWARKRAQLFWGRSASFKVIKEQQQLIELSERKNRLKLLITEAKYTDELIAEKDKMVAVLEDQYRDALAEVENLLPGAVVSLIKKLVADQTGAGDIIAQIKPDIPSNIPAVIIEDYISEVVARECEKQT